MLEFCLLVAIHKRFTVVLSSGLVTCPLSLLSKSVIIAVL